MMNGKYAAQPRLVAALILLLLAASSPAGEHGVVVSDRQGRATPWVSEYAVANSTIVPYSSIPMLAGVPQRTDYYAVDTDVVEAGYFYYYFVRGKRHDYVVESTVKLFRLIYELEVLEQLANHSSTGDFFKGVAHGVRGIGIGIGALIDGGEGIRNAGHNFGRLFKSRPRTGQDEKGEDRGLLGGGPAGADRRKIAFANGLDVYTDNPDIRDILNRMARTRTFGNFTAMAATGSMIPVFNTSGLHDDAVERFVSELDPSSLRIEVGERLGRLFNMRWNDNSTPLGRFIHNPNFTPRQVAYVGKCLGDMAQVQGVVMILGFLSAIDNPETADLAYLDLRMHHIMHMKVQPLAAFVELENIVAAMGTNGDCYLLFPGDVLSEWSLTGAEVDELIREAIGHKARALKILALGVVKPNVAEMLRKRGVQVFQNVVRDPRFFSEDF